MNYLVAKLSSLNGKIFYPILLFIVSFAIYIPSLNNDFVWDDQPAIEKNFKFQYFINILEPHAAKKKSNYYRPTIYLSYLVDSTIWGKKPFGYHLSNNIFNSCVVVLLFWFVYYFFRKIGYQDLAFGSALITSFLFMAHPIHVESVSWVSARTDVLCTLFLLMGILLHMKSSSKLVLVIFALAAFYFSMLSKELGILFLPLILLLDLATGEIKKRNSIIKYILYIFLVFLYFYVRSQSHVNITNISDKNIDIVVADNIAKYFEILKVLASSYYSYIYKLFLPIELNSFIYDVTKDTYYLIGAFSLLLLLSIMFIFAISKNLPIIYFSIFWILLTLGPSSLLSIIKMTPSSLAERYLYLPSIGFCILIGYTFNRLIKNSNYKKPIVITLLLILSFYAISTINRQKVWENDLTLWKDASIKSENACFPHNNYGTALRKAGRPKEAINQYIYVNYPDIKCRDPEKSLLYNNFGVALLDINKTDQARKRFEDSIRIHQYYFKPHMNLGASYLSSALISSSSEDFKRAKYYLTNAVELKPSSGDSHHYLSIVYKETGELNNAEIHAKKALRLGIPPAQKRDALRILDEIQNSDLKEY